MWMKSSAGFIPLSKTCTQFSESRTLHQFRLQVKSTSGLLLTSRLTLLKEFLIDSGTSGMLIKIISFPIRQKKIRLLLTNGNKTQRLTMFSMFLHHQREILNITCLRSLQSKLRKLKLSSFKATMGKSPTFVTFLIPRSLHTKETTFIRQKILQII